MLTTWSYSSIEIFNRISKTKYWPISILLAYFSIKTWEYLENEVMNYRGKIFIEIWDLSVFLSHFSQPGLVQVLKNNLLFKRSEIPFHIERAARSESCLNQPAYLFHVRDLTSPVPSPWPTTILRFNIVAPPNLDRDIPHRAIPARRYLARDPALRGDVLRDEECGLSACEPPGDKEVVLGCGRRVISLCGEGWMHDDTEVLCRRVRVTARPMW